MGLFSFSSGPDLFDHEKARVEYHLQQIAECLGTAALRKPVAVPGEFFGHDQRDFDLAQIHQRIGHHLDHDISKVQVRVEQQPLQMCGSGGG